MSCRFIYGFVAICAIIALVVDITYLVKHCNSDGYNSRYKWYNLVFGIITSIVVAWCGGGVHSWGLTLYNVYCTFCCHMPLPSKAYKRSTQLQWFNAYRRGNVSQINRWSQQIPGVEASVRLKNINRGLLSRIITHWMRTDEFSHDWMPTDVIDIVWDFANVTQQNSIALSVNENTRLLLY